MFPAGTKDIPLGTPIAIVVDSKEDIPKFKDYKVEAASPPPAAATPAPEKKQEPKKEAPKKPEPVAKSSPPPVSTKPKVPEGDSGRVFATPMARRAA